MSETTNTSSTPTAPEPVEFRLSINETYETLQKYIGAADNTLTTLQNNINAANNQINEWRRYELVLTGQKQLLKDLIAKIASPKDEPKAEAGK